MSDSVDITPQLLKLSTHQQSLYIVLHAKGAILGTIYHGALSVFQEEGNPDRLALTAHGLRELMEKIPRYLDLPQEKSSSNMLGKVRGLQDSWRDTVEKTNCLKDGRWSGTVDKFLERFLKRTHEFFQWVEDNRPKRKQSAATVLRKLDPLPYALPEAIEKLRVNEWECIHDYFEKVAHHNGVVAVEEFTGWLASLERFLLDRLIPRTFEDHAKIDEIIEEGEKNAEP